MKYTLQIEIEAPVEKVVELFNSADNLPKWMDGLLSYEHLDGKPGEPGAKARLIFKRGKGTMEMTETIRVNNLPEEFSGTYEAGGVLNIQSNRFQKLKNKKTLYTTENEFRMKGFLKLMGWLMPGAFKKQSMKYMRSFKEFVENQ